MVNEKRERGLFVAIFGFCHITINFLHFCPNGWSNILKTMTYYAKLIDITLIKLEFLITTISHTACSPQNTLFHIKQQKNQISHFLAISDYLKCQNGWSQLSDVPNTAHGLSQDHLKRCGKHLGTMVNEKRDIGLFVAIIGFCHITINYLHVFGQTVGPTYRTP